MDESDNIHDLIATAPTDPSWLAIGRLLNICEALNKRIDTLEAESKRAELLNRVAADYQASDHESDYWREYPQTEIYEDQ